MFVRASKLRSGIGIQKLAGLHSFCLNNINGAICVAGPTNPVNKFDRCEPVGWANHFNRLHCSCERSGLDYFRIFLVKQASIDFCTWDCTNRNSEQLGIA